jgi:hypothetical protein
VYQNEIIDMHFGCVYELGKVEHVEHESNILTYVSDMVRYALNECRTWVGSSIVW